MRYLKMRIMLRAARDSTKCARLKPASEPRRSSKRKADCSQLTIQTKARKTKRTEKMATVSTKMMKRTKKVTTISDS